ncbi:YceI family protein [Robiginitalea aurantiaca]|uniref:YceI family protein n=1 Tax=Robiginitalea aurantiaca TaxID=3056915 RepID=A0ABT7WHI1_9FLAO|nr:YceI family protein [Robiginitalea aurantiaca]MDM9632384.1 YceI family protein [Robiginitalea aurantiaca]
MKRTILTLALSLFTAGIALATEPVEVDKKEVKAEESKVAWKAYKVTGSHNGTVTLKSGTLMFDNDKLSGGEFAVDMTSLIVTDIEGGSRYKLEGHLKSDDFFAVESHPTATLVFTKVKSTGKNSYEVTGDLTIKEITKPVTFDVSVYGSKATATMKVDRTDFDIKYGSGSFFDDLGDKTIYDEFDLVVDLEF